jgi:hypothetical protein
MFETDLQNKLRRGMDYRHPLDAIKVVGALVEAWPAGNYIYLSTKCPTAAEEGSYSASLAWYIIENEPPETGQELDWLCSCVRAERVSAVVCNSLIIRQDQPAVVGRDRSPLWPETFETVLADDL